MSEQEPSHVDVFDGLRAAAIGLVMWLHVWQLSWMASTAKLPGGYPVNWGRIPECGFVGVELFFFISGFCLFYPYARYRWAGGRKPALGTYVYRRAIKILPSYWLAIGILLVLLPPGFQGWREWAWQIGSHAAFVHNWWPETLNTIDGVFWSLGVEVQFYVLFPIVALAFMRFPVWSYLALQALAVGWRLWCLRTTAPDALHYSLDQLPGYLDLFANGLAAAALIVWARERGWLQRGRWAWTLLAIAALYALWWLLGGLYYVRYYMIGWPAPWQALNRAYVGEAFLVLGVASAGAIAPWRRLLSNRLALFLSAISYNLYLWHQLVARYLFNHGWPPHAGTDPHLDPTWQWQYTIAAMAGSIALATLITYVFERPLLRHGVGGLWRRLRRARAPEPSGELTTG